MFLINCSLKYNLISKWPQNFWASTDYFDMVRFFTPGFTTLHIHISKFCTQRVFCFVSHILIPVHTDHIHTDKPQQLSIFCFTTYPCYLLSKIYQFLTCSHVDLLFSLLHFSHLSYTCPLSLPLHCSTSIYISHTHCFLSIIFFFIFIPKYFTFILI